MPERIYFDQAATSWPKPETVYQAVDRYQRELGVASGRGPYGDALEVGRLVTAARRGVARLIGAADHRQVVFTFNGTDSLNLAIHGALADGGHVVTTVVEHNSVLRPLRMLEAAGRIEVSRVGVRPTATVDPDDVRRQLRSDTRLVVLSHASNVTGAVQPAAEIGRLAREAGALFLLDAAQTLGELPLNVDELNVDLLAAPGHKGLLGPLGTGILYLRPGSESRVASVRQGGTGSHSDQDRQPDTLPDKYEAGNLNVPGIVGLGAAVGWLAEYGIERVRAHGQELTQRLLAGLADVRGVALYGPAATDARTPLVSMNVAGLDAQELAAILDAEYGIQCRSGMHCAPLMHRALGTADVGGTVRFSLGPFNTLEQVEIAIGAVRQIAIQCGLGDSLFA
jgi:cysteine desulfurase / selenocysteine lyase